MLVFRGRSVPGLQKLPKTYCQVNEEINGREGGRAGLFLAQGFLRLQQQWAQCILTVEEDDPAVATAGLGVIPEADAVALGAGRLPVLPVVGIVSTEASVARLHPSKLPQQRSRTWSGSVGGVTCPEGAWESWPQPASPSQPTFPLGLLPCPVLVTLHSTAISNCVLPRVSPSVSMPFKCLQFHGIQLRFKGGIPNV